MARTTNSNIDLPFNTARNQAAHLACIKQLSNYEIPARLRGSGGNACPEKKVHSWTTLLTLQMETHRASYYSAYSLRKFWLVFVTHQSFQCCFIFLLSLWAQVFASCLLRFREHMQQAFLKTREQPAAQIFIHRKQASMPPARFEPAIPASERPQSHVLDRAATGIGSFKSYMIF